MVYRTVQITPKHINNFDTALSIAEACTPIIRIHEVCPCGQIMRTSYDYTAGDIEIHCTMPWIPLEAFESLHEDHRREVDSNYLIVIQKYPIQKLAEEVEFNLDVDTLDLDNILAPLPGLHDFTRVRLEFNRLEATARKYRIFDYACLILETAGKL